MTLTNRVAKAFTNKTSWTKMTWWKTSFNMPVPNIFDDNTTYTETEGMITSTGEATSFDLSWYEAWWEVVAANSVFTLYWPFAWWVINCTQAWKNAGWTTTFTQTNSPTFPSLAAWFWSSIQLASNQWVAAWEIDSDQTFTINATTTWGFTASQIDNITFTNVPDTSTTYTPGMTWIQWNDLRWSSANWHLHTMVGTAVANPWATAGMMWIEWNYIYWIGTDWQKYRWTYNFQQFWSAFSGWPSPATVSWATAWMTWMDNNFGYEHIGYIASDGTKWINNSWENPYA